MQTISIDSETLFRIGSLTVLIIGALIWKPLGKFIRGEDLRTA